MLSRNQRRKNLRARRIAATLTRDYALTGYPRTDTDRGWDRRLLAARLLAARGLSCADVSALRILGVRP